MDQLTIVPMRHSAVSKENGVTRSRARYVRVAETDFEQERESRMEQTT